MITARVFLLIFAGLVLWYQLTNGPGRGGGHH